MPPSHHAVRGWLAKVAVRNELRPFADLEDVRLLTDGLRVCFCWFISAKLQKINKKSRTAVMPFCSFRIFKL